MMAKSMGKKGTLCGPNNRVRVSMRIIVGRKEGWLETTLVHTHNHALSQGHNPWSYEGRGS
jgi:hypothetical protein